MNGREAIIYGDHVDIRFADLDFYGHVNSKHYLDFVATARLNFLANEMKFPINKVTEKGVGFYLTKSTINYKRPIGGLQRIFAKSQVSEVRDGRVLVIPFQIMSANQEKVFSDGVLEYAVVSMETQRSTTAPDWMIDLFFKTI